MTKTKIMATLATDRATHGFISMMRRAGIDSVRINSAHVDPVSLRGMIASVRAVDPGIRILMDTKGPEIRTTYAPTEISLAEGDTIEMASSADGLPSDRSRIHIAVADMDRYVNPGMKISLDDGEIELEVTDVDRQGIITLRTIRGGLLGSRKTVSLDTEELPPLPAVSVRDRENIEAALEAGIDMIAHSFVREAADVRAVRKLTEGSGVTLYAKIECRAALRNMDEILGAADGLLVARGDLGTACPLSEIPAIQHEIISRCRRAGKPSILATQILQTMISNPIPTRAELSDVALAVMEGADTLLLCGETALGAYPEECIEIMRQTIESVEKHNLRCRID